MRRFDRHRTARSADSTARCGGPLFALIGAAACSLFALWLVGVVHLAPEQYAPTLALAGCGGRMSWIVYRATQPGA